MLKREILQWLSVCAFAVYPNSHASIAPIMQTDTSAVSKRMNNFLKKFLHEIKKNPTEKVCIHYFQVRLDDVFPRLFESRVEQMSLSLLYNETKMEKGAMVPLKPMEIYSFLLKR